MNAEGLSHHRRQRACRIVLLAGLLLRLAVFHYLPPQNNDNHYEVILHIHNSLELPPTARYTQAYQPPLYHALAACFLHFGDVKTIQILSLLLSLATLILMHALLARLPWLDGRLRPWLLALPALHPQFVIYTLLVSNDTLAILLGTLIFYQAARLLERPTLRGQTALALCLGLGLMTKFTFLAFIPPVALLIILANVRSGAARRTRIVRLAGLLALSVAVGSPKYVDNAIRYGRPFISNLDFPHPWIAIQRPTWRGLSTLFDINVLKLARRPTYSDSTGHSWPLMLYGTFWYSYIFECGFRTNRTCLSVLGSWIDLAALAPTLLMGWGVLIGLKRLLRQRGVAAWRPAPETALFLFSALSLLGILAMIIAAGWKYDVWSVFQGRLFFPAYAAFPLLLNDGWRRIRRCPALALGARLDFALLFVLFLLYFGFEMRMATLFPVHPTQNFFGY